LKDLQHLFVLVIVSVYADYKAFAPNLNVATQASFEQHWIFTITNHAGYAAGS
jgi:hypothetical protein